MITINELNQYLIQQAEHWEKEIAATPALKGSNWPDYYRKLINLDQQTEFMISSAEWISSPVSKYLAEHEDEYDVVGYTGCAYYKKKLIN